MCKLWIYSLLFTIWFSFTPQVSTTPEPGIVVRAVLFYSPTCGHCELVIRDTLIPLIEKYGNQLQILGINITQPEGPVFYQAAREYFKFEGSGVPLLIIGETVLFGSLDIPERFPALVEQYMAQGGVDWPAIPGLIEAINAAQSAPTPTPGAAAGVPSVIPTRMPATETSPTNPVRDPTSTTQDGLPVTSPGSSQTATPLPLVGSGLNTVIPPSFSARFALDPLGNSLSVIVLVGMLATLALAAPAFQLKSSHSSHHAPHRWKLQHRTRSWLFPALSIIGMAVAGYLAYVETANVSAACGPVGDCNTVQQSEYARLFGVLPIGVLGVMGYVFILASWLISRSGKDPNAHYANLALLGFTTVGTLFSVYLTFLEPFVIGATCAWCLSSAIIMTALFWISLEPGRTALIHLTPGDRKKRIQTLQH